MLPFNETEQCSVKPEMVKNRFFGSSLLVLLPFT